ncbi:tandem large repeat [Vibrio sp. ZSDE26]|uniref:Tandem large repeat n=1 Tax=Vibrio amylolyticus TaxID=2847292 RepID=A0A9X2BJL0_9VIBR|nr:tandem large repeat [Vibrio amylolyticus]
MILSACGGDSGDGNSNEPPSREVGSISGIVYDAPVSGANVYVWEYVDGQIGKLLGRTTTDAFGNYFMSLEASNRLLLVSAQGGGYVDPLTNETVSVSNGKVLRLDSVINYEEGERHSLMVTPLTNMVAGLARFKIENGVSDSYAVNQSLQAINGLYGFDVNTTRPIDITQGGQSSFATPGHKYGALLTAYSSLSFDLIEKYGNPNNVYTSMHLADIQYRDVSSNGLLDGREVHPHTGMQTPITFGMQRVTSDLYTAGLAKHVLIVVNDPELNISGTQSSDYIEFSHQINTLGTPGGGGSGVIPPRDGDDIDTDPPEVERTDNAVLSKIDKIDVTVSDNIGIDEIGAFIQYQVGENPWQNGFWELEIPCSYDLGAGDGLCALQLNDFQRGQRVADVNVEIDTLTLDALSISPDTGESDVSAARIVVYAEDALGNKHQVGDGVPLEFEWNNKVPVINVLSESTIGSANGTYELYGTVTEQNSPITLLEISGTNLPTVETTCNPHPINPGVCEFKEPYLTQDLGSSTIFTLVAQDMVGNRGEAKHEVRRDAQAPNQAITYPTTNMDFVVVSSNGDRNHLSQRFESNTYTESNIQTKNEYLKIEHAYASEGIKNIEGVDFEDFHVSILQTNKIPYVRVLIYDPQSSGLIGSSADKLQLNVEYHESELNNGNYRFVTEITSTSHIDSEPSNIPHEKIVFDGNDYVEQMVYYIPFTSDILGGTFSSKTENSAHKLVISTTDEAGNKSALQEVYFRNTFDLPSFKVITPFIGVNVELLGLDSNGGFIPAGACQTDRDSEIRSGNKALDVASCDIISDVSNFDFLHIRLTGNAVYYQWEDDPSKDKEVHNLISSGIGVYFPLNGSQEFYLTELSAYHTGLFDYKWHNLSNGQKTYSQAKTILDEVKSALALQNNAFFGFDPTDTRYATNEDLRGTIPPTLNDEFHHRFLVEALVALADTDVLSSSVDIVAAFYDDLSHDGLANGRGANGEITIGNIKLSAETYRKVLAEYYYRNITNNHGISLSVAQAWANKISEAYPQFFGESIFGDDEGGSIDEQPPAITLKVEEGRFYEKNNRTYVAGAIDASILLEDPSGIVDDGGQKVAFNSLWFTEDDLINGIPANITPTPSDDNFNNPYEKSYRFTLNSDDPSNPDISDYIQFMLEVSATDTVGNDHGFDNPPYEAIYHLDNEPPKITYRPPTGDDDTFLNVSDTHLVLTFDVEDLVDDIVEDRSLVFTKPGSPDEVYGPVRFASNSHNNFSVNLCTEDACKYQETSIFPGDGEWTVYAQATDNLQNSISARELNAPRFKVNIDTQKPLVESETIQGKLSGNGEWRPVVTPGLSGIESVDVKLKLGSLTEYTLEKCDSQYQDCSHTTHLTGKQPEIKVQLVASDFNYSDENQFIVTAKNNAYPQNQSDVGKFTFQVDNKGPDINVTRPWVVDSRSGGSDILGKTFKVTIDSLEDDSAIASVSLYQVGNDTPIITINDVNKGEEIPISLVERDTNKIVIEEDKNIELYLKAIDEHGFESDPSTPEPVLFDREGPEIYLSGLNPDAHYLGSYQFRIDATDYVPGGDKSPEGINEESLRYWVYRDTHPGGNGTAPTDWMVPLDNSSNGTVNIEVAATDVRGNATTESFEVNVYNTAPNVTSHQFQYDDGTVINGPITQNDNINIVLNIEDEIGVESIEAFYRHSSIPSDQDGTSVTFIETPEEGGWKAALLGENLSLDGTYYFKADVFNKVRFINQEQRAVGKWNTNQRVERLGATHTITSPNNFQQYVANSTLDIEFRQSGEVPAKFVECWVRNNYQEDGVPDNDFAYSTRLPVNDPTKYSCSLETDRNIEYPATLITRTEATNGTLNIQKFTFQMMDIDTPTVEHEGSYYLHGNQVSEDLITGEKMITIDLDYKDTLSGVDISDGQNPRLFRMSGRHTIYPSMCGDSGVVGPGIVRCTYTGKYSEFLDSTSPVHEFEIRGLKDNAGNPSSNIPIELKKPNVKMALNILSPIPNEIIRGDNLEVEFEYEIHDNTRLDAFSSPIDGSFSDPKSCQSKALTNTKTWCATFRADLAEDIEGATIEIVGTDVFGEVSNTSVSVIVDNVPPIIGEHFTVSQSPDLEGYVRFTFNITDMPGSGIDKVNYSSAPNIGIPPGDDPENPGDRPEDGTGSAQYFEVPEENLSGHKLIIVQIRAFDKAGNVSQGWIEVDVSVPTIELGFSPNVEFKNTNLILDNINQSFTISTKGGAAIGLDTYELMLTPTDPELNTIKVNGSFNGSSNINEQLPSLTSREGQYDLTLKLIDKFGGELTRFDLLGGSYTNVNTVIDFNDPQIGTVTAEQTSSIPVTGKYPVEVTAVVKDQNLNEVWSQLFNRGTLEYVNPMETIPPADGSDAYTFKYLVDAGDYDVKVFANDLAENSVSHEREEVTVIESSQPFIEDISFYPNAPIGGGKETTVTILFSEPIIENDITIRLTANEGSDVGSLVKGSESWVGDNIYAVNYRGPNDDKNKTVTLEVEEGSYQSINTIPGRGESSEISINAKLPTLTSVVFSPIHQVVGGTVDVTFEFNESVTGISAKLGSESVTGLTGSGTTWEGAFVVGNTSGDHHKLTVSDFEDNWGNIGLPDTSYRLPITPTITVDHVETVNKDNVESVYISGSTERFPNGNRLSATFTSENGGGPVIKDRINVSDDRWNFNVNLKALNDGEISLVVEGQNAQAVFVEGNQTFTLEASEPSVAGVVLTPKFADDTEIVTIEASFNKPVTKPSGSTLGSNTINWSGTADSLVWQGTVEVSANINDLQLPITIKGYQDSVGNMGDDYTDTSLPLTPHITIIPIEGDVNEEQAKSLLFEGASDRFLSTDKLTLDIEGKSFIEVDINSSGAWNKVVDVSDLTSGSPISYNVSGTNEYGAVAVVASSEFTLDLTKPTVSSVSIDPEIADVHDEVQVEVEFDSRVTIPNRSNIGGIEIDWETKGSNTKTSWVGIIVVPDSIENAIKTLAVTIGGFADSNGNTGNDHTSTPLVLKPSITFNPIEDVSLEDAGELIISGVTTRFSEGQTFEISITDNNGGKIQKAATIGSGGSWSIVAKVDTLALGTISVTASGNNGYTNANTSTDFELVEDPVIVRMGNQTLSMGRLALNLAA